MFDPDRIFASMIPDMTRARLINKWIKKGFKVIAPMPTEIVTFISNKLDTSVPKDALPVHIEKRKTYVRKFSEMSKPERIFELGGVWGASIAYQRGKITAEELPDEYFPKTFWDKDNQKQIKTNEQTAKRSSPRIKNVEAAKQKTPVGEQVEKQKVTDINFSEYCEESKIVDKQKEEHYPMKIHNVRRNELWNEGTIRTDIKGNVFEYYAKVYDLGSQYGIDDGRVSKLTIIQGGNEIVNYDRGWDISPKTKEQQIVCEKIVDYLENIPTCDNLGKNRQI